MNLNPSKSTTAGKLAIFCAVLALVATFAWSRAQAAADPKSLPDPAVDAQRASTSSSNSKDQTVVISGGCFWGIQAVFQHVKGVKSATSGYSGGSAKAADYELVSTGATGHAESVEITYDPSQITYGQLLKVFFSVAHDPTQLNRQGPDSGTQYRSAIFYADDDQKRIAEAYIAQLQQSKTFAKPIVTRVDPLKGFFAAEAYHQDYLFHNPKAPYIAYNDIPKVENFQRLFPALYSGRPALIDALAADRR